MAIQQQVHSKFKVFVGDSISDIADKAHAFTAGATVAPKSIGVEFVESLGKFLLSLGYAEGQDGYAIKISEKIAGPLPSNEEASELCTALETAAASAGEVICHELYVDNAGIVHMVFMEKA